MTVELNPKFSFENFVVGANNGLAVRAARAVAEAPGTAYNPLFIYSATGLGKTHLLMAVGQQAKTVTPALSVEYLTLEEFVEAFHAAVAAGQGEAFRHRFGEVDVLLVDDVHFLANRKEMQAELLRLTNELQAAGRQMVLASDRPPGEIADLDERLIARFSGGLVVDIGRPEFETRLAILRRRAEERGGTFGDGVLEAVAGVEVSNVRELLGALNRLLAFQAVHDSPVAPEAVVALLGAEDPEAAAAGGTPAAGAAAAAAPATGGGDEFAEFMSDVTETVAQQVESWKVRLSEAILRWEGEGYRTARLSKVLDEGASNDAESSVEEFERDVGRLRALEAEMSELDAAAAGDAVFRNPDRVAEAEELVQRAKEGLTPPPGPSTAWAFEDFVGGESNKLALSGARAVAEQPGSRYNPLVLVGPAGVGKTHLLHGIGHALAVTPGALVACLSAQDYLDELVQAIEAGRVDAWRSRYRRATAFLLDDVHLLAGKDRSQEELFNLFNLLSESDRQMVFTLKEPPRRVEGLDERLVSRMEGGLLAVLPAPDRELRLAIVSGQLTERLGLADEDLSNYLADRPADSVRSLLALVQRVLRSAEAREVPPSAALARELFEGVAEPRRRSTVGVRTSGLMAAPTAGIRSREKMVWRWPEPQERLVEELS